MHYLLHPDTRRHGALLMLQLFEQGIHDSREMVLTALERGWFTLELRGDGNWDMRVSEKGREALGMVSR